MSLGPLPRRDKPIEKFVRLEPRWLSPFSNLARPPFTLDVSPKCSLTLYRRGIFLVGTHNYHVAVLPSFREKSQMDARELPRIAWITKDRQEPPWTSFKGEARRDPLAWHTYSHARTRVTLRKYRQRVQIRFRSWINTLTPLSDSKIRAEVTKHLVSHRGNERREEDRRWRKRNRRIISECKRASRSFLPLVSVPSEREPRDA